MKGQNRMGSGKWRKGYVPPKTRKDLERALAASERIMRISTQIRERHGLEPLEDNRIVTQWRAALAATHNERGLSSRVEELAKRRAKLERDQKALSRDLRELVALAKASRGVSVTEVARGLGISRQRVYQLSS